MMPTVLDMRVVSGKGGGPDKTILNSPRFLTPLGYRMLCGYLYPPGDPGYAEIERKAAKYGAPLISIPDRGPLDWRIVKAIYDVCRRDNVAIWHGHDYKTNALGLLLNKLWPMKLVTTAHGWVEITRRTPWYYRIDKFCLPRYERVYCVSEDLYRDCRKCGVKARNAVLLENGIDTGEFTRRSTVVEAKRRLGLPQEGILVGAVGRLSAEKAFDLMLRSVRAVHSAGTDIRLVVLGDGNERSRLEALAGELGIADRVTFAGWQSEAKPYYEAFDLFALSSLREGLPNVLLEAMAMEVPCLATRIAGIPKLIQHGTNGLLAEAGDLEGFTRNLGELAANLRLRRELGLAARHTIESRYSFARRMEKLARSYDELLGRELGFRSTRRERGVQSA
jgi:glycosyltransferase involved in cell wall biosynthesis